MPFNWKIYRELNIALRRNKLTKQQDYERHYETKGKSQKLPALVSDIYPDFTTGGYAKYNPDLKFTTPAQFEDHWIIHGRKEGRRYKDEQWKPSFHVLVATGGRQTIINLLRSLLNQLESNDYLTIVFDGPERAKQYDLVSDFTKSFKCTVKLIIEEKNLGHWGHGIRNKHNKLAGDFIMHADDDDFYLPGVFVKLRHICNDPSTIYVCQFEDKRGRIIFNDAFGFGTIGTPSGVIPAKYNADSVWQPMIGGDNKFYTELSNKYGEHFVFIPLAIYTENCMSPRLFNWEQYRKLNADLKFTRKEEFEKHWREKGVTECRLIS